MSIAQNADEFLPEGNRYFRHLSPVDVDSFGALTTTDKARHLGSLLEQDQQLGEVAARGATNELREEEANRRLSALRNESASLQALEQLDPFEDGFATKASEFSQMAALSPAVGRALDTKLRAKSEFAQAMGEHAGSAAEAELSDEEFVAQQSTARELLRRGDVEGYSGLLLRNDRLAKSKAEERLLNANKAKEQQKILELQQETQMDKMTELQDMERDHLERINKLDVPLAASNMAPDFFSDEMAGDPERLPAVVNAYVSDSLLSSTLEGRAGFTGLPILDSIMAGAEEGEDVTQVVASSPEAQGLLQRFSRDAASMSKERFIATYSAQVGSEDENGDFQGTPKEQVARVEEYLEGIHKEVNSITEFSKEKEIFRGNHPEFAKRAQEIRSKRIADAKAKSISDAEARDAKISAIISNAINK